MDNNNTFYDQNQNVEPPNQQQVFQQQQYQQASYENFSEGPYVEEPMSVSDWLMVMLVMCIPCVNLIMMFVWAFSNSEKKSKSNYFKASLIWAAIIFGAAILFVIIAGISVASVASGF